MENIAEILTPKNKTRSLGLKRSIQRNNVPKTPLSDVKVNYKSLEDSSTRSSPSTPCLSQRLPLKASAYTTNCVPYRLSLSRRVRDKYKKKKLEFASSTNEAEADTLNKNTKPEENSPTDLTQAIIVKERILNSHERHQEKVQELKNVINSWTVAFKRSLEELSSKIEPRMEAEDLISRLGIPPEMIEYA